jgi:hypothetical protein
MAIALAITIALLLVVAVALLGTMREVVVLQGKVAALTDLLLNPPSPQFLDGILPDLARQELSSAGLDQRAESFFLIFTRQGCSGCASLLQEIKAGVTSGALDAQRFACVITGRSGGLEKAVRAVGILVLVDGERHLEEACQVRQTPTVLHLDGGSLKVLDSMVGADLTWIRPRLTPRLAILDVSTSSTPQ